MKKMKKKGKYYDFFSLKIKLKFAAIVKFYGTSIKVFIKYQKNITKKYKNEILFYFLRSFFALLFQLPRNPLLQLSHLS